MSIKVIGKGIGYTSETDISDHILLNRSEELSKGDKKALVDRVMKDYEWDPKSNLFGRKSRVEKVVSELLNDAVPCGRDAAYTSKEDITRHIIVKHLQVIQKDKDQLEDDHNYFNDHLDANFKDINKGLTDILKREYGWNKDGFLSSSREKRIKSAIEKAKYFIKMQQCAQIQSDILKANNQSNEEKISELKEKYSCFSDREIAVFARYPNALISDKNPNVRISEISKAHIRKWDAIINYWDKGSPDLSKREIEVANKKQAQDPKRKQKEKDASKFDINNLILGERKSQDEMNKTLITNSKNFKIQDEHRTAIFTMINGTYEEEKTAQKALIEFNGQEFYVFPAIHREFESEMRGFVINNEKVIVPQNTKDPIERNPIIIKKLDDSVKNFAKCNNINNREEIQEITNLLLLAGTQQFQNAIYGQIIAPAIDIVEFGKNNCYFYDGEGAPEEETRYEIPKTRSNDPIKISTISRRKAGYRQDMNDVRDLPEDALGTIEVKTQFEIYKESGIWKIRGPFFEKDFLKYEPANQEMLIE